MTQLANVCVRRTSSARFGLAIIAAIAAFGCCFDVRADDDGFVSIFDGKTLDGWDGNPKFWSVEEGTITGQTTADNPTKGNTFLIWRKGNVADFELTLEYRIQNHNSGIQYRSFEVKDQKWVVGGYQADIEGGDTYSGILYGEKFRGILAKRGEKTVLQRDKEGAFKVEVAEKFGDGAKLQSHIKKEDWNSYQITAKGNHFVHKINGQVMSECTDNDKEMRREKGILALQLHAGPPMKVQFRNIRLKRIKAEQKAAVKKKSADNVATFCIEPATASVTENVVAKAEGKKGSDNSRKRVAFVAGTKSHGYGSHEHQAGCMLLAKTLEEGMPNFDTIVYTGGWPKDPHALDGFDAIVMYSDGGGGHMINRNLAQVEPLMKKGVGLVCVHYAVEVPESPAGEKFLDWIGGYFEANWSVNPHWTPKFAKLPEHPITNGVKPFSVNDEWYYHMRFPEGLRGVTPILTDLPPDSTLTRPDGPHSGNPHVREAIANKEVQHMAWATERDDGGRGFGFTGGHVHWNWGHDDFRRVVLNAIVWTAKAEVPKGGVPISSVTVDDLEANQDYEPKSGFDRAKIEAMLKSWKAVE